MIHKFGSAILATYIKNTMKCKTPIVFTRAPTHARCRVSQQLNECYILKHKILFLFKMPKWRIVDLTDWNGIYFSPLLLKLCRCWAWYPRVQMRVSNTQHFNMSVRSQSLLRNHFTKTDFNNMVNKLLTNANNHKSKRHKIFLKNSYCLSMCQGFYSVPSFYMHDLIFFHKTSSWQFCYPCFADEETEAQKDWIK